MTFSGPIRSLALSVALATLVGSAALLCPDAAAQSRHGHGGYYGHGGYGRGPYGHGGYGHPVPMPIQPPPPPPPGHPLSGPPPAPIERRVSPGAKGPNGEHLAGWLDHHSNLTAAQQQQALEREPGFADLPPPTQQRMRDRLAQLNSMPPDQRSRLVSRTEAMERLSPEERGQVRSTMQQLGNLPPPSRRAVSRAFRNLRDMPPDQRNAYLNSPEIRSQFNDQERSTLSNLMEVEPYLPPQPHPPNGPNP
jgi:hypothetical protein